MTKVPDLHYVVVKKSTVFARAGHATVFYRHDRDGRPFIYHLAHHYGEDGRLTRAAARRHGSDVVSRRAQMFLRDTYVGVDLRAAVRAAGLDPSYVG